MRGTRGNWMQHDRRVSWLILAAAFLFVKAAAAQTAAADSYAAARANGDRQAKEWIARGIPGLSLTVARSGPTSAP